MNFEILHFALFCAFWGSSNDYTSDFVFEVAIYEIFVIEFWILNYSHKDFRKLKKNSTRLKTEKGLGC